MFFALLFAVTQVTIDRAQLAERVRAETLTAWKASESYAWGPDALPPGRPYVNVKLKTGKTSGTKSNPAEIGTLLLEFGTLAKLTKKPVYYDKAKNALVQLFKRRSKNDLVGEEIDVETGEWTSRASH